jgi:hypothetical protein
LKAGRYEVRIGYTAHGNRATNVPVEIHHAGGIAKVTVNQRKAPPIDGLFLKLGVFEFAPGKPAALVVSNRDVNGYVIIDGAQFIPVR